MMVYSLSCSKRRIPSCNDSVTTAAVKAATVISDGAMSSRGGAKARPGRKDAMAVHEHIPRFCQRLISFQLKLRQSVESWIQR